MAGKTPRHIHEVDNSDRNPTDGKSKEDQADCLGDFNFLHIGRRCCSILNPLGVSLVDPSYSHKDFAITEAHDGERNPNENNPQWDGESSVDLKWVKTECLPRMEGIVVFAPK